MKRFFSIQWWSDLEFKFGSVMNLLAGGTVLLMTFITVADITGRTFHHPISGTYELVELMMAPAVFLALFYAQRKNVHIRVEILTQRLPKRVMFGLESFSLTIGGLLFGATTWYLFKWGVESWSIREVALGMVDFPVYPFKFLAALGCLLLAFRYLVDAGIRLNKTIIRKGD